MSNHPGLRAGLLCLSLALPTVAPAAAADYNFLEASWLKVSPDDDTGVAERDGYQGVLWSPLEPGHFMQVRYERSTADGSDAKISTFGGGLGYYGSWSANIDAYLILGYEEFRQPGEDDKAYTGELGLRLRMSQAIEFNAGGQYYKMKHADDASTWFAGAVFSLTPGFGLTGRYTQADEESRYTIGLRLLSQ